MTDFLSQKSQVQALFFNSFSTSVRLRLQGHRQVLARCPKISPVSLRTSTNSDDIFDDISPAASNVTGSAAEEEAPKKSYKSHRHRRHHRHHHYHTRAEEGPQEEGGVYSSNHGSFRFLNAEDIDKKEGSSSRGTASKFSAKERQKAKEHQKIQWSDNEDRLI